MCIQGSLLLSWLVAGITVGKLPTLLMHDSHNRWTQPPWCLATITCLLATGFFTAVREALQTNAEKEMPTYNELLYGILTSILLWDFLCPYTHLGTCLYPYLYVGEYHDDRVKARLWGPPFETHRL